mmetsp:Transcript_8883/g.24106  ORF Transcript_8883/g.24106 Transcript_8883/m.24106 type:complete len:156 (-) Transcript_8883:1211-1678(-)
MDMKKAGIKSVGGGVDEEALKDKEREITMLRSERDRLYSENSSMKAEMDRLREEAKNAASKGGADPAEVSKLKNEVQQLQAENEKLKKSGGGGGGDTGALQERIKYLEKLLEEDDMYVMMKDFTEGTQAELEKERSQLLSKIADLEQEISVLKGG